MKRSFTITSLLLFGVIGIANAQVGIGTTNPNADAILDLESASKGLKYPKVALSSTTVSSPLTAHVEGMTVYNTATANDVTPGIYVNDGTKWNRMSYASTSSTQVGGNVVLNPGESFYYVKNMPRQNGYILSEYFTDVPVIDGIRMDVFDNDNTYYSPRLYNTTASSIKIHYSSIASINYEIDAINITIPAASTLTPTHASPNTSFVDVDDDGTVYGSNTTAETETVDVVIGTKWYRLFWFCYRDSSSPTLRTVRMSITRLQ